MPVPQQVLDANSRLFYNITAPLEIIFERICKWGIPISPDVLLFKAEAWKERMQEAAQKVYDFNGESFNFDSHVQVKKVLYGKEGKFKYEPVRQWSKQKREMVETVGQYAFGHLFYHHKEPILKDWSLYRRLRHRYSNFVAKFLRYELCSKYVENSRGNCEICAGTKVGRILGFDPRYITDHGDHWRTHAIFMLLAVTGRPISLDPNMLQIPREDKTRDIHCRDIFVARPGYKIVLYDLAKAELFVGGFITGDKKILSEVALGNRAFSIMASEVLGIPEDQCAKGTDWYTATKVARYANLYFVQAQTLHEFLMKQDIFIPVEVCEDILTKLDKRYAVYRETIMEWTWKWLTERSPVYINTFQGRIFRANKPYEIEGYSHYKNFIFGKSKARTIFFEMCRKFASFIIQGSSTADNCQGNTLLLCDTFDKMVNPIWNQTRFGNGNYDIIAPLWPKYDENAFEVREDWIDQVKKTLQEIPGKFAYMPEYLGRTVPNGLELGIEVEEFKQWDVKPEKSYEQMTRDKNPKHFYENGIRFKA